MSGEMITPEPASGGRGRLRPSPHLAGTVIALAMKLVARTWRRELDGIGELDRLLQDGRRFLLLFWHGKYLPLFALLAGRQACIFTSRSYRGDIISEVCRRFGYRSRSLPPDPEEARSALRRTLAEIPASATAADGPLGPGRRVKHALVEAAAESGALLLPVGVGSHPRLVRARRWDRMEIPLPFARLVLSFGSPLSPPAGNGTEAVEKCVREVEDALERLEKRAEEKAARRYPRS